MPPEIETETTTVTEQTTTQAEPQENEKLLSALEKERTARANLEKELKARTAKEQELQTQLERVKAIDPDQYDRLKKAQAERDEQTLLQRQEFDKAKKTVFN